MGIAHLMVTLYYYFHLSCSALSSVNIADKSGNMKRDYATVEMCITKKKFAHTEGYEVDGEILINHTLF